MPRVSSSTALLSLVVLSLDLGLATMPLVKIGLEVAIPGSDSLWRLTHAEWLLGDRSVLVAGVVPWIILAVAIGLVLLRRRTPAGSQTDAGAIRR